MPRTAGILLAALVALPTVIDAASYDDGARFAFTPSPAHSRVYVLDLKEQELAGTIEFAEQPDSVSASDSLAALVVAHRAIQALTLVDLRSAELVQLDYPLELTPDYVSVSPLGETVVIYDAAAAQLEVHAIKRRDVLLQVEDVHSVVDFTFSADGSSVYWPDEQAGVLKVIDLWSERMQLPLGLAGQRYSAMSRSADGLLGFLSNADTGEVYVINLRTFSLLTRIRVPGGPGRPWGTADGRYMFVASAEANTVTAISTQSLQALYSVKFEARPTSIHPGWLDTIAAAIDVAGNVVFFEVESGKLLERHDLQQGTLEALVTSDSKTMAIPVPALGEIVFLDMRSRTLTDTVTGLPKDLGNASIAVSNNLCH